jgi:hypothetical protein
MKGVGAAPTSSLLDGPDAVAIGTANLALGDLSFNYWPGSARGKKIGYTTELLPYHVIEFENAYIYLTAINTGMDGKISGDKSRILC